MKNPNSKTVKTPVTDKPVTDPIEIAKRNLDFARADYKRIREINAGPKEKRQVDPERASVREKLKANKEARKAAVAKIKETWKVIDALRAEVKKLAVEKKALWANIKTTPRAHTPKNKAVEQARIDLMEAELAWRKACLG